MLGYSMRTVVILSIVEPQTWPTCTCRLCRQGAGTSGPSLPPPVGPPGFFYFLIPRGKEETMASQLTGSPLGLEDRSSVQTVQCSDGDIPCNLQELL